MRGSLGDRFAAQLGMGRRGLAFAIAGESEPQSPRVTVAADQSGTALESLERVQTLTEVTPEREEKRGCMGCRAAHIAVREALERQTSLLLEVTVGGNDYTPALLPALEWLAEAPASPHTSTSTKRLVIVCANQQGARRLLESVLPRLQASLKSHLPVAYLAERGGYLCVHRWFGSALRRTSGELTVEQARGLAKLGLLANQTLKGQSSSLTSLSK